MIFIKWILIPLAAVSAQVNAPLDADITTLLPRFTGSLDIVNLIQLYWSDTRVGVYRFFKRDPGLFDWVFPPCDSTKGNQAFRRLGCLFYIARSCPGLECDSVIKYMPPFLQYHMNNPLVAQYRDLYYGILAIGSWVINDPTYPQKCLNILAEATSKLQAGQRIFKDDAELFAYLMIKYRFATIVSRGFAGSSIGYVYQTYTKVSTMSETSLKAYIDYTLEQQRRLGFIKRAEISYAGGVLTYNSLLQSCNLTSVANPDITAGCVAGIIVLCAKATDRPLCHDAYQKTFGVSVYSEIVNVCPKWKSGPLSDICMGTLKTFNASKPTFYPFASFAQRVIFTNDTLAPA